MREFAACFVRSKLSGKSVHDFKSFPLGETFQHFPELPFDYATLIKLLIAN